jgi:hypothetical protein
MTYPARIVRATLLVLFVSAGLTAPSRADTGSVRIVITKAGFVVGVGRGRGVLTFRGHDYPFRISGASLGATLGASIARFAGRAIKIRDAADLAGTYAAVGAGATLAGGVGSAVLKNENGVILQLRGVKVGMELSVNLAGATITLD